jgi:small subunit ribosomal protein S16
MPVKIRLTRMGKKKQPSYRVVVVDSRKPRDGAYIEQIGRYDPRQDPSLIEIDNEKALDWLGKGAQPTDRVRKLLEISGAWTRFRVVKGDIHTVGEDAPAAPAEKVTEEPAVEEPVVEEPVAEAPAGEAEAEPEAAAEAVEEAAPVAEAAEEGEDDEG